MVRALIGLIRPGVQHFLKKDPIGTYLSIKMFQPEIPWKNIQFGTQSEKYNCIGHALNRKKWLEPSSHKKLDLIHSFEQNGYKLDKTMHYERGFGQDRIILYGTSPQDLRHVAKVTHNGSLSSKLGTSNLVKHTPNQLINDVLGKPQLSMTKQWLPTSPKLRLLALQKGNYTKHIFDVLKKPL